MSKLDHTYEDYWETDKCRIIDCKVCGFKHMYPFPESSELEKFYKEQYFKEIKNVNKQPIHPSELQSQINKIMKNKGFKGIYSKVEELLNSNTDKRFMLDVGCGHNLLSVYFSEKGWDTAAIEPSETAGEYLRSFNLNVFNDTIEAYITNSNIRAHFINIQYVLEHIKDPLEILKYAYEALEPGGIIRIAVPNDFSIGQLAYQDYYDEKSHWIAYPDHINYFNFESLKSVIQTIGFKEVYRTTNFPLEFLLLGGINYYSSSNMQKQVGPFVKNFENSFKQTGREKDLNILYENLANMGMGRVVIIYAQK